MGPSHQGIGRADDAEAAPADARRPAGYLIPISRAARAAGDCAAVRTEPANCRCAVAMASREDVQRDDFLRQHGLHPTLAAPDILLNWVLLTASHKSEYSLTRLEAAAKWLREGGHVDARAPEDGYASGTLLMLASGWCHAPVVSMLLLHDADVDARNAKGNTALILACLQPQNDEVVQLLLEKGADVDRQSDRGNTALIGAALYGHDPTVRLLLDRRADPDLQDEHGNTALHCACSKGRDLVVQLLLVAGANVEMCEEEQGLTAYDLAERAGHAQIARRILRWQVHKLTASRETEAREAAEAQAAADEVDGARRRAGRARSRSGACAEPEAVSAEAAAEAEAMAARRAEELLVSEAAAEMLAATPTPSPCPSPSSPSTTTWASPPRPTTRYAPRPESRTRTRASRRRSTPTARWRVRRPSPRRARCATG